MGTTNLPQHSDEIARIIKFQYKRLTIDGAKTAFYIHLNNATEATPFILMLVDALDNNCMGGYTIADIKSAFYLNGWIFYQLKDDNKGYFEVFVHNDHVSNVDIRFIEQVIHDNTN